MCRLRWFFNDKGRKELQAFGLEKLCKKVEMTMGRELMLDDSPTACGNGAYLDINGNLEQGLRHAVDEEDWDEEIDEYGDSTRQGGEKGKGKGESVQKGKGKGEGPLAGLY